MDIALVMFKKDGARRDFSLSKARSVIGRINTCDLRIPLSAVSRNHCEIDAERGTVKLRDLGSSNGTFHNGTRIRGEVALNPGDRIQVGPVIFTLVIDGVPAKLNASDTLMAADAKVAQDAAAEKKAAAEKPPARKKKKKRVKRKKPKPEETKPAAQAKDIDADDALAELQEANEPLAGPTTKTVPYLDAESAKDDTADEDIPVLDDDEPLPVTDDSSGKDDADGLAPLDDVDLDDPIAALEAMASGESGNDLSWLADDEEGEDKT